MNAITPVKLETACLHCGLPTAAGRPFCCPGCAAAHDIMRMLADFAAAGGVVVAVLHAIDLAQLYCTRLLVLHQGRVLVDDTAQTALPHAATAFGLRWGFANQPTLLPPEGIGPDGKN